MMMSDIFVFCKVYIEILLIKFRDEGHVQHGKLTMSHIFHVSFSNECIKLKSLWQPEALIFPKLKNFHEV